MNPLTREELGQEMLARSHKHPELDLVFIQWLAEQYPGRKLTDPFTMAEMQLAFHTAFKIGAQLNLNVNKASKN